jgi:release factor glutamine methyltransferase
LPRKAEAALAEAAGLLRAAGVDAPAREARLLLAHAQHRAGLPDLAAPVPDGFAELVRRRCAREPMALIVGRQGFWTLDLATSPRTLVPRADTETLIEAALAARPDRASVRRVLDLGTGTGALLLAALGEFPRAWGLGVDRVPAACVLARDNARAAGLAGRAGFLCADWAAGVAGQFDLVLVNPPYVRTGDIAGLMPEVTRYEPASALDGGPDGLDAFRRLLPALPVLLAPAGMAILEVGAGQAPAVESLAREHGLAPAGRRRDLGGIERAVLLNDGAGAPAEKPFGRTLLAD